ncbi:MAG TPA: DUF4097 family beta strand repeat-containing protein [Lysobacter sp.]
MTRAKLQCLAFGLAVLTANSALAATPINETRPLDPRGKVEVENVKGRVDVRTWDRPEVKIEGSLGQGVEKLEIEGDGDHLTVRVKYPNRGGGMGLFGGNDKSEPTDLRLTVPVRADLDVDVVSADVTVEGIASSELSIDAVSGDVTVAGAPAEASVDTVSGDLNLTLNSARVRAESVSGDLTLRGRMNGEVDVETVSGRIDVAVLQNRVQRLSGSSVSGDIRVATGLASNGRISLETVSGDLTLVMPRDLSANVRGESFSGDLTAPGAQVIRPKHGPGSSFEHRFGSGDGDISIDTFSGDATLQLD